MERDSQTRRRLLILAAKLVVLNTIGILAACDQKPPVQVQTNPNPDKDPKVPPVTSTRTPTPGQAQPTSTARVAERPTPNPAGTPIKTERETARSDGLNFTRQRPSPSPISGS